MTLVSRTVFWVLAYLCVVIAPLVFAAIGASDPDHGFWTNFSVALAFVGLAMMGLEFVLVAPFKSLAAPFGQDGLLQFHRQIGLVGLAFVFVHVAISTRWAAVPTNAALRAPALVWCGVAAAGAVIVLVVTSVWRRLHLSYELWHAAHTVLAVVAVLGALAHIYLINEYAGLGAYVSTLWKQLLWGLMSAGFIVLLVWVRLIKPRAMRDRARRLERVGRERGQTTMHLTVVHVLEQPPANWAGESGFVNGEILSRHLPQSYRRFQFFICGPDPTMDAAEHALLELGVPGERVHTDRFGMV